MFPVIRSSAQWRDVRDKIDLVRVARAVLGEPEKSDGDTFCWFCPFHNDDVEPLLQISEGKLRWNCWGCDRWGDAVDLVRQAQQLTFSKALAFLSRSEFYPNLEEMRTESTVGNGEITANGSIETNDDSWIDDLLRDAPESAPETGVPGIPMDPGIRIEPGDDGAGPRSDRPRGRITLPLKWHGGKYYLAPEIVALMPPHIHYVEPFCGGCAVLLARDPDDERLWVPPHKGVSELINDVDGRLANFWKVLRDPRQFGALRRRLEATPLSRVGWIEASKTLDEGDEVDRAASFFGACRQTLAGRRGSFTPPTRTRLRRGINGNASEWLGSIEGLPAVHARLKRVFVESMDAVVLMGREDSPGTLFYCDPPYLHETRASPDAYEHEMTAEQHGVFLDAALPCKGKVMISGYPSELYDGRLAGWDRKEFDLPNNAAGGDEKRRMTEVLWTNYRMSP
jgi:DNA adenine methylase